MGLRKDTLEISTVFVIFYFLKKKISIKFGKMIWFYVHTWGGKRGETIRS